MIVFLKRAPFAKGAAMFLLRALVMSWMAVGLPMAAARVAADVPAAEVRPAEKPASATIAVDALDQAALQEVFYLLRRNFVQRESLTLLEMNRAALEGLLRRLDFGAEILVSEPPDAPADGTRPALVGEKLTDFIGYLRPVTFTPEELPVAESALRNLLVSRTSTLVLDLRAPAPHGEFGVAARWLSFFIGGERRLFTVQKAGGAEAREFRSGATAVWDGKIVVLIDAETNNVGETIAAVLRAERGAPIFGTPTRGRTMEYQDVPLSPTHRLRFASAEMIPADGRSLFRKGLEPTVRGEQNLEVKHRVFRESAQAGVRNSITRAERPRLNERSLVTRTAPELEYHLAKSAGQKTPYDDPPLEDRVLQQTVDVLVVSASLEPQP